MVVTNYIQFFYIFIIFNTILAQIDNMHKGIFEDDNKQAVSFFWIQFFVNEFAVCSLKVKLQLNIEKKVK